MPTYHYTFDSKEVAILQLCSLFDNAHRQLHIFSPQLDFNLWGEKDVIEAMKAFLLKHAHNQLELVQVNTDFSRNNAWVQLAKRLSRIQVLEIEQAEAKRLDCDHCFALADQSGVFIQPNPHQFVGYCNSFDNSNNKRWQEKYSHLRRTAIACRHFTTLMV